MNVRAVLKPLALPLALVAIGAFFATQESSFLGSRNLTQLIVEFTITATLALGMFLVILTGNIDLSVGSGVGLIGGISAVLINQQGWPAPAALAIGVVVALVLWAAMGALIVKERIPSFIITLGGMLIFKGLFWRVIGNSTVSISHDGQDNLYSYLTTLYLPKTAGLLAVGALALVLAALLWRSRAERTANGLSLESAGRAWLKQLVLVGSVLLLVLVCNGFRGVPLSLVILAAVAVAIQFLTQHTPFGRYLYAIGGNEEAASVSGIAINRVLIGAYVLMGLMTALTGFMATAYVGATTTTVGDLMELDAIAACVIGGTALKGGRGTVWGVILGALVMTTLLNGMGLMGVAPETKFIARGIVLVLAVWLDVKFGRE